MKKIGFVLAAAFFLVGIATSGDYGINWDSPEHWMRGNAILSLFLTGQKHFSRSSSESPILVKPGELISRYNIAAVETGDHVPALPARPLPRASWANAVASSGRFSFYQSKYFDAAHILADTVPGHFPLADILSAAGNRLLYVWLGWMGDIVSYQVFGLLVATLGVFIVTVFAGEITGSSLAAIVAGISLSLYPYFITHAHVNIKDPIVAVLYAGTLWSVWHWVRDARNRWGVAAAVFFALGLAVKWTIGFAAPTVILWLFAVRHTPEFRRWWRPRHFAIYGGYAAVAIVVFLVMVNPSLWADPIRRFTDIVKYYWSIGTGAIPLQPKSYMWLGFNSFPVLLVFTQTPEILLALLTASVVALVRTHDRWAKASLWLIFIWFVIPVLRLTVPGFQFYGGLNQFMEVVPAIAVLAGIGAFSLYSIRRGIVQKIVLLILIIPFILLLIVLIHIHPLESVYFNTLTGGVAAADDRLLLNRFNSYGSAYKLAADWINANAPQNANVAFLDGSMMGLSPMFLRDDISISPGYFSGFDGKGEYIVQILYRRGTFNFAYRYALNFLRPVHTISVYGVPILTIYKNDAAHRIVDLSREQTLTAPSGYPGTSVNGKYWDVFLNKFVRVTRIIVADVPKGCQETNTRFVDDAITFFTSYDERLMPEKVYTLQERRLLANGDVEYDFAAEPARKIRIYIASGYSCFIGARVASVSYLPE